jgi:hypothetical protein
MDDHHESIKSYVFASKLYYRPSKVLKLTMMIRFVLIMTKASSQGSLIGSHLERFYDCALKGLYADETSIQDKTVSRQSGYSELVRCMAAVPYTYHDLDSTYNNYGSES